MFFRKTVAKHVKRVTLLVVYLSHDVNRPLYWRRAKLASGTVVCLLQNAHVTLGQYGSKQSKWQIYFHEICSDFNDHYSTSRLSSECRCNYNLLFLVLDHKLDLIYKARIYK